MLRKRVIPILQIIDEKLVKSTKFKNHKYVGDPLNAVRIFNQKEVDEIIVLSREVSKKGGIYTSHLRDEGLEVLASIDEAIKISEKADITVILTHHKVIGKPMWGKSIETLRRVDDARERGLDIRIDQYPYNASHTGISVLIPSWARAGGQEMFKLRLENEKLRDSILNGIVFNILNDRGGEDLDRIQFAKFEWMPELEGKTLKYWCNLRGIEPTTKNGAKLLIGGKKINNVAYDKTILLNPSHDDMVSKNEIFGPVACIYTYDKFESAIEIANSVNVSFQSSIFTNNINELLKFYKNINASAVFHNDHTAFRVDWMPFAGLKESGHGVGGIKYTMYEMQIDKMLVLKN